MPKILDAYDEDLPVELLLGGRGEQQPALHDGRATWRSPERVARRFPRPDTAYRAVEGHEPVTLAVAWSAESRSPAVAAFVRTAKEIAEPTVDDGRHAPVTSPM